MTAQPVTVEFEAAIANGTSAIKIDGEPGAGGRVTFAVDGSNILGLLKLTQLRGTMLRVKVEVLR